ncbi:MAG: Membrane proteins related to metalloendopeptidases [uncultured Thermomicrobiales bacterium]|uniref:Membrane proteins related to metalloendopeptidases n=1 Tax=uncultured Thermomicrobiales bacterium TaxID=1645740 RepID=A0A6J4UW32_9BACT|nr:MAG: Membrane proteins related to metalloendopeptidases [uncultured Thermomicrobiales bacterium]
MTASRTLFPGRAIRTLALAGLLATGTVFPLAGPVAADEAPATPGRAGSGFDISVSSVEELTGLTAVIAGTGETVALRSQPEKDAAALVSIPDGSTVALRVDMVDTVLDADGVTRWWPISFGGRDGWVEGFYLTEAPAPGGSDGTTLPTGTAAAVAPDGPIEPFDFTDQATAESTARVAGSGDPVNVRAEPSADSEVVATAADGRIVLLRIAAVDTVYDPDGVTRWWPVSLDGVDGWISGFYLVSSDGAAPTDGSSPTTTFPAGVYARASAADGRPIVIRAQASADAPVVGEVANGNVVRVIQGPVSFDGSATGWYEIATGDVTGFISGGLVIAAPQPNAPGTTVARPTSTPTAGSPPDPAQPTAATTPVPGPTEPVDPTTPAAPDAGPFAVGDFVAVRSESGAGVNVREAASITSQVVGFRPDNAILRVTVGPITDPEGVAWYGVEDGDVSGFILASLLISSVTPTAAPGAPDAPEATTVPGATTAPQPTEAPGAPEPTAEPSSQFSYPLANYRRTQGFGCSSLPFYQYDPDFGCAVHTGLDLAAPSGTPLLAAGSGTVTVAGWSNSGFGYYVEIDHGNGLRTLYGHMVRQPSVARGQQVNRGDVIGAVGSTGISTGPHVHFEVRLNGQYVNPENYLP